MLFEGTHKPLGVPETDLLGNRFYRFRAQPGLGGVYAQALDIIQYITARVLFERTGEVGTAHLEFCRNGRCGQLVFGVMVKDIPFDLLHPAGGGGCCVLLFFVSRQFIQDGTQLLLEIRHGVGTVQALLKILRRRKVPRVAQLFVYTRQDQRRQRIDAVLGDLDILHAAGQRLAEQLVEQGGQAVVKGPTRPKNKPFDAEAHDALAQTVAEHGAVLLKNEGGILPLQKENVALIGEMARTMRYQGAGSSHINPTKLTTLCDAWPDVPFTPGCDVAGKVTDENLAEAASAASAAKVAVVCVGLPEMYESEGFDRETMAMPEGHIRLIEAVAAANPNTVVVLFCGSAVETPWLDKVKAVLYMGLPGQAGGAAAARLLTGAVCPGGKLTETWPLRYEDVPSCETFGKKTTHYKEGLYVGYRYYDKAGVPVRFPFGYGLSYTQFEYSNLKIADRTVSAVVKNIGNVPGAEVVQLYIAPPQEGLYRPARELRGFARVELEPGESKTVEFTLDDRSFAVWSDGGWKVPAGRYGVLVGASSADIRLREQIEVAGEAVPAPAWQDGSWYETLQDLPTDAEFEALYGGVLQNDPPIEKGKFTMEYSTMEMKDLSFVMMQAFKGTESTIAKGFGGKADYSNPTFKMMVMAGADSPLRAAVLSSGGAFPASLAEGLLATANGHPLEGVKKIVRKK